MVFVNLNNIDTNKLVLVPKLNMHLNCGTLVVYDAKNHEEQSAGTGIGRILEVDKFEKSIKINKLNLLVEPPQSTLPSHCRYIPEVVETEEYEWQSVSHVKALAFVFIVPRIHRYGGIQGMDNLYVIRKRSDNTYVSGFPSFSAEIDTFNLPVCNAKRIFDDIIDVKQKMRSILSSEKWAQGIFTRATQRTKISPECWKYLQYLLGDLTSSRGTVCNSIRHVTGAGLDSYSLRIKKMGSVLTFSTDSEIGLLIGIFGETCFCGIRKKRPRLIDGTRYIAEMIL